MDAKRVVLSGGPEDLPDIVLLREIADLDEKVKVQRGAGYEHFLPTAETRDVEGEMLPVFEWCATTRIAE